MNKIIITIIILCILIGLGIGITIGLNIGYERGINSVNCTEKTPFYQDYNLSLPDIQWIENER